MIQLAKSSSILLRDKMKLNFGVGYQLDLQKNYDRAFSFFKKANELVREDNTKLYNKIKKMIDKTGVIQFKNEIFAITKVR